jgi:hypothetical protein
MPTWYANSTKCMQMKAIAFAGDLLFNPMIVQASARNHSPMPTGLTQQEITTHWPALLMLAGVIILGVLAAILIRDRMNAARMAGERSNDSSIDQARLLFAQSERAQEQAASLIESASTWSERFVEHTANLQRLLAEMDEKLVALERIERQVRQSAVREEGPSPAQPQPAQEAEAKAAPPALQRELDPFSLAVHQRADAGNSPAQIARELNEHIGKVELILALRRM